MGVYKNSLINIQELIVEAITCSGVENDLDIVDYVNARSIVKVNLSFVTKYLDELYGDYYWTNGVTPQ